MLMCRLAAELVREEAVHLFTVYQHLQATARATSMTCLVTQRCIPEQMQRPGLWPPHWSDQC